MTTDSPKGPEREARPGEVSLQDRVAEHFRVKWGYAEMNEWLKRSAGDAIDALAPELERLTAEVEQLTKLAAKSEAAMNWSDKYFTRVSQRAKAYKAERDEWRQAAEAEADLLDQEQDERRAEVSRLREQLATAVVLPQDADEQIHAALEVNAGVHTGGQLADQTDAVLALIRSWGVSSPEVEAPTLPNESFISQHDEGRPSGSGAATPHSEPTFSVDDMTQATYCERAYNLPDPEVDDPIEAPAGMPLCKQCAATLPSVSSQEEKKEGETE